MRRKGQLLAGMMLGCLTAMTSVANAGEAPPGFDIWVTPTDEYAVRNVTARAGYDNQPVFANDGTLYFTRYMPDGQTDIAELDLETTEATTILKTPESEYSPTPSPRGTISVVRVALDGVQQLWELKPDGARFDPILPGLEGIGYHLWLDPDHVALFMVTQPAELHVADVRSGEVTVLAKDIGRGMQVVPGTRNAFAFIEPGQDDKRWIKQLDLDSKKITPLAPVLNDGQDFVFRRDGMLVMASGKALFGWDGKSWNQFAAFPALPGSISRLAFSPSGRQLAMVVAEGE